MTRQRSKDDTQLASLDEFAEFMRRRSLLWDLRIATISDTDDAVWTSDGDGIPITLDGDTATVNAYSMIGSVWGGARAMVLQISSTGYYIVGYAGSWPYLEATERLRVLSTADVSYTSTDHPFQVGSDSVGMVIDTNQILARSDGTPKDMFINTDGSTDGVVVLGCGVLNNDAWLTPSITPSAVDTPTSASMSWGAISGAGSIRAQATPNSAAAGLTAGVTGLSSTGGTLTLTSTVNTTSRTIFVHVHRDDN